MSPHSPPRSSPIRQIVNFWPDVYRSIVPAFDYVNPIKLPLLSLRGFCLLSPLKELWREDVVQKTAQGLETSTLDKSCTYNNANMCRYFDLPLQPTVTKMIQIKNKTRAPFHPQKQPRADKN